VARHALYYLYVLAVLVLVLEAEIDPTRVASVGRLLLLGIGAELVP
jgi:hypothetical protein